MVKFLLQIFADPYILNEKLGIILLCKPSGIPAPDKPQSKTYRMHFLTQGFASFHFSSRTMEMWLVLFRIGVARPIARGVNLFKVAP